MARAGRTRKPCPGCGGTYDRPVDKVCEVCERLLRQSHELEEWALEIKAGNNDQELVVVAPPHVWHWWPQLYMGSPRGMEHYGSAHERLEQVIAKLAVAVSQPVDSTKSTFNRLSYTKTGEKGPGSLTTKRFSELSGYGHVWGSTSHHRVIRREVANLIRELYESVAEALIETYDGALKDGHDLILELAAGRLTIDKLNEATLPTEKRRGR